MNEYQIFFFIVLPVAVITMLTMLIISMNAGGYDDSKSDPEIQDTFEDMNDGE